MLVTGAAPLYASHHPAPPSPQQEGAQQAGAAAAAADMGFLRTPHNHPHHSHHLKVPSPLSESLSERFSTILDHCHKKIRLLQAPSNLFNNLVT